MKSYMVLNFRRSDDKMQLNRDSYAIPSMSNRKRSFTSWRNRVYPLNGYFHTDGCKDWKLLLLWDYGFFTHSFAKWNRNRINEYEEKKECEGNPEKEKGFLDNYVLEILQRALRIERNYPFDVAYSITLEDIFSTHSLDEIAETHWINSTYHDELLSALELSKRAFPEIRKKISFSDYLASIYPKEEYEFMELFDRYIAEDKKSISYLKQIADDAKEQYLKHLSNDTLSEILTKKELSVKDSFTAYLDRMQGDITNDLYEKLLLESPLFQFYIDKYAPLYTDEQCVKLRDRALKNLDYNLRFFSKLDQGVFRAEIARFLASRSDFIQVDNLKDYDKKAGVYIMVLGNYCQLYIGVSSNISQRIQAHWMYNTHPLDRLIIMGDIEHSKICVDAFGPLDTTEIYAKLIPNPTVEELSAIEQELITGVFSDCFLLNRTSGGLDISKISFRVDLC